MIGCVACEAFDSDFFIAGYGWIRRVRRSLSSLSDESVVGSHFQCQCQISMSISLPSDRQQMDVAKILAQRVHDQQTAVFIAEYQHTDDVVTLKKRRVERGGGVDRRKNCLYPWTIVSPVDLFWLRSPTHGTRRKGEETVSLAGGRHLPMHTYSGDSHKGFN